MPKQVRWGIYAWIHNPTGRMYVGQAGPTTGFVRRRNEHRRSLRRGDHHSRFLQRAWNKHGDSEFAFVVLEDMTGGDLSQLTGREQHWMDTSNSAFNLCPAAGSTVGYEHTIETRALMSEVRRGVPKSIEHRAAIAQAHRGKQKALEHIAKIAASQRGKKRGSPSSETLAKRAVALRKSWEDPEVHARRVEALRKSWTPERRAAASRTAREQWANPEKRPNRNLNQT